jgi:hypothetical protein
VASDGPADQEPGVLVQQLRERLLRLHGKSSAYKEILGRVPEGCQTA